MTPIDASYIDPLKALGLTGLEAEIYGFLVGGSPATGYRVARAIERPAANTYQSLSSLLARGAVMVSETEPRRYRAVAPDELLLSLQRRFEADRARAAEALSGLATPERDEEVYRLQSSEQVLERLVDMIGRARESILASAPVWVGVRVRADLAEAASRGVAVILATNAALDIPGAEVVAAPAGDAGALHVVVDRSEMQIAAFDGATLRHAIHTSSSRFAENLHRLIAAEHLFVALSGLLEVGLDIDNLEDLHRRCLENRRRPNR